MAHRYVTVPSRDRLRAAAIFAMTCLAFGAATAIALHRLGVHWLAASLVWAVLFDISSAVGEHAGDEPGAHAEEPSRGPTVAAFWIGTLAFDLFLLAAAWLVQVTA